MSLSERINQAQQAAAQRGEVASTWRQPQIQPLTVDGLGDFKAKVHDSLFERLGTRLFEATSEDQLQSLVLAEIGALMDANESALSPQERQHLVRDIARDVMGLGPIEQFLADPTVTEVMVNGGNFIYVERNGVIEQTGARFISEEHLRRVIERIVSSVGRRIDEASPMVDARLADGSRVNVIVPPLSLDGSILTIRKFAKDPFRVHDLIAMGTITEQVASVLAATVEGGMNILISGGTGTGKTTMLNVLSSFVPRVRPDRHHRGCRRAAVAPGARDPSGGATAQHRRPRARSPFETSCATPCACARTASSSVRSAAPKRWTCFRP